MKKFIHTQKGFSVLFASLIGSLVLAIGLAILSITLKQISLASSSRESQRAFYAADSGTEFALYLDRGAGFSLEECPYGIFPIPGISDDVCKIDEAVITYDGIELNNIDGNLGYTDYIQKVESEQNYITTQVSIQRTTYIGNPICFDIFVTKTSEDGGETVKTRIESRGYSTCNETSSNRFERAILTTY